MVLIPMSLGWRSWGASVNSQRQCDVFHREYFLPCLYTNLVRGPNADRLRPVL